LQAERIRLAVIPVKANILLIEGKRAERPSFFMGLTRKGFHVESVSSGSKALDRLSEKLPHLVLVDAASMRTSGKRICQSIQQVAPGVPVVLVVEKDHNGAEKFGANVVLAQPFTLQKLLNRIRPLLPTEDKNLLVAGPLRTGHGSTLGSLSGPADQLDPAPGEFAAGIDQTQR
jgi:DNA-binding response OmpR family regulator